MLFGDEVCGYAGDSLELIRCYELPPNHSSNIWWNLNGYNYDVSKNGRYYAKIDEQNISVYDLFTGDQLYSGKDNDIEKIYVSNDGKYLIGLFNSTLENYAGVT